MHLSAIYRELVAVHASSDDERATLAIECLLLIDRIIPEPELLLKMIATCDPPHPQVRWDKFRGSLYAVCRFGTFEWAWVCRFIPLYISFFRYLSQAQLQAASLSELIMNIVNTATGPLQSAALSFTAQVLRGGKARNPRASEFFFASDVHVCIEVMLREISNLPVGRCDVFHLQSVACVFFCSRLVFVFSFIVF